MRSRRMLLLITLPREPPPPSGPGDAAGAAALLKTDHVRFKISVVVLLRTPAAVEDRGV